MSKLDQEKWDLRYSEDSYRKNNPVTLLQDWLPKLPVGKALDLACGAGRNAIYLAQAGYRVDAIDISPEGLKKAQQSATEQGLAVNWIEHDLDQPFNFDTDYNLILVMWYVNPGLITRLCDYLAPGGYLLSQEHLVTDEEVIGPTNNDYRMAPGILRATVPELEVLLFEESVDTSPEGERLASARLVARKDLYTKDQS